MLLFDMLGKMKKRLIITGILLTLLTAILSGCTDSSVDEKSRFVGTWRMELVPIYVYTFYANGTVTTREVNVTYNLTYKVEDGKLSFYMPEYPDEPLSYYYFFSDNDTRLNLSLVYSPENVTFDLIKIE